MKQKEFTITFLDKTYPAIYITGEFTALTCISTLMKHDGILAIDTETKPLALYTNYPKAGLSPHLATVRLLQIFNGNCAYCFDMDRLLVEIFLPLLQTKRFIAHNALFDLQFFMNWDVKNMDIGCTYILTKLVYHAYQSTDSGLSASLSGACEQFLKVPIRKELQVSDWGNRDLTFEQIEYACTDVVSLYFLAQKLAKAMTYYGLERIYNISRAAQHPIAAMQLNGIKLNVERHLEIIAKWREELYAAKKEVTKLTGLETFTSTSLGEWLEENLPPEILQIWPRTDTGKLSTDAHTFAEFEYLPIVKPFSEFQKKSILATNFGNRLIDQVNPETKRLHPHYKICGARTGRLSCTEPNIQQAPKELDFRKNIVASPGCKLVGCDFSQIEIRVAAELSGDRAMQHAYRNGIDLHTLTASKVMNKPMDKVTKEERQIGKALGLGLLFGLGAKKFSHYVKKGYKTDISQSDAAKAVEGFREAYPEFREWQITTTQKAAQTQTVRTTCGKLRKLDTTNCYGGSLNTPVQGTASEIMLCALIYAYNEFKHYPGIKLVACVHDEILLEVVVGLEEHAKEILESCMIGAYLNIFPNGVTRGLVEGKIGNNWSELK